MSRVESLDRDQTQSPTGGSREHSGGPSAERVTVNLSSLTVEALSLITGLTDVTKTEAINKALRFYSEITQLIADGGAVYIREAGEKEPERIRII